MSDFIADIHSALVFQTKIMKTANNDKIFAIKRFSNTEGTLNKRKLNISNRKNNFGSNWLIEKARPRSCILRIKLKNLEIKESKIPQIISVLNNEDSISNNIFEIEIGINNNNTKENVSRINPGKKTPLSKLGLSLTSWNSLTYAWSKPKLNNNKEKLMVTVNIVRRPISSGEKYHAIIGNVIRPRTAPLIGPIEKANTFLASIRKS